MLLWSLPPNHWIDNRYEWDEWITNKSTGVGFWISIKKWKTWFVRTFHLSQNPPAYPLDKLMLTSNHAGIHAPFSRRWQVQPPVVFPAKAPQPAVAEVPRSPQWNLHEHLRKHGSDGIVLLHQDLQVVDPLISETYHPSQMGVVLVLLGVDHVIIALKVFHQALHIFRIS